MGKSNGPLNARELHGRHQSRSIPRAMALQSLFQSVVRTKSNVVAGVVVRHVEVNDVDHVPLHGRDCPRPAGHAAAERSRTKGRRLQLFDAPSSLTARTAWQTRAPGNRANSKPSPSGIRWINPRSTGKTSAPGEGLRTHVGYVLGSRSRFTSPCEYWRGDARLALRRHGIDRDLEYPNAE